MPVTCNSSVYRYVRRVKRKWQARIPVGGSHLNLGLYDDEWLAWRAAKAFINRGEIPPHVLPKYVRQVGGAYVAKVTIRGRKFVTRRYSDPNAAHRAMVRKLTKAFPEGLNPSKRCWRKGPNFGKVIR